jgi:hypothetical protein
MLGNEAVCLIPDRSSIMTQAITPLRQRMIDDMRMRKLLPKTQSA